MNILVINGANINQLGKEPHQLNGPVSLAHIEENMHKLASEIEINIEFFQSNIEGEIVNKIHQSRELKDGIIINAGSYSQTSMAIADAIKSVFLPAVEIILGNITMNVDERAKTIISPSCVGLITGFGPFSYHLGLLSLHNTIMEIRAHQEQQQQEQQEQKME
jgi:3-dehydroquinate dehydratase II